MKDRKYLRECKRCRTLFIILVAPEGFRPPYATVCNDCRQSGMPYDRVQVVNR